MPKVLQWFSYFSPLRYYIDGALAIAIKGVSIGKLANYMVVLAFQGLLLFIAGNYFLTKRM
jgi:ABC-2 type transport system permease protein